MVEQLTRIWSLLKAADWTAQRSAVEDLVALLSAPLECSEREIMELIDAFASFEMKWEVREALAAAIPRMPAAWAARVEARLEKDPNAYVRRSLVRARRSRSRSSFVEAGTQPTTADELVARYSRVLARGNPDVTAALRTVALEAQGLAVAEFAHALKNIIQRVLTPAAQIKRRLGKEEKQRLREPLAALDAATDSLTSFSTNLSWLAQGKKLPFIQTTLRQVVHHLEDAVKPTRGITLRASCGADATFEAVPIRLEEALSNILRNAIEASPDDGVVFLDAYRSQDGEEILFVIKDQGPGIPKDDVETWFQLGKTSKQAKGNTGLGLFIARNVIEFEHGGSISVSNAEPHGAIFQVRVPTQQQKQPCVR